MSRAEDAAVLAAQLSVVSGSPDESELAALVAGIAAAVAAQSGVAGEPTSAGESVWSSRAHQRGVTRPSPTSWRWSHR